MTSRSTRPPRKTQSPAPTPLRGNSSLPHSNLPHRSPPPRPPLRPQIRRPPARPQSRRLAHPRPHTSLPASPPSTLTRSPRKPSATLPSAAPRPKSQPPPPNPPRPPKPAEAEAPQENPSETTTGTGLTDQELEQRNLPPLRGPWIRVQRQAPPLSPREQAEAQLQAIESSYSGWLGGTSLVNARTGSPGYDQLAAIESPFEASAPLGYHARITVIARPVFLDSGQANGTANHVRHRIPIRRHVSGHHTGADRHLCRRAELHSLHRTHHRSVHPSRAAKRLRPGRRTAARLSASDDRRRLHARRISRRHLHRPLPVEPRQRPLHLQLRARLREGLPALLRGPARSCRQHALHPRANLGRRCLESRPRSGRPRQRGVRILLRRRRPVPHRRTTSRRTTASTARAAPTGASSPRRSPAISASAPTSSPCTTPTTRTPSPTAWAATSVRRPTSSATFPSLGPATTSTRWHYNIMGALGVQAFQEDSTPLFPLAGDKPLETSQNNPMLPNVTSVSANYDFRGQVAYQIGTALVRRRLPRRQQHPQLLLRFRRILHPLHVPRAALHRHRSHRPLPRRRPPPLHRPVNRTPRQCGVILSGARSGPRDRSAIMG